MPYSETTTGTKTTPGGCKVDNGRCFASMRTNASHTWLTVTFGDGSVYTFEWPLPTAWIEVLEGRVDPGCPWNAGERPAIGPKFHKGKSSFELSTEPKLTALPPDYIFIADT